MTKASAPWGAGLFFGRIAFEQYLPRPLVDADANPVQSTAMELELGTF
uniref:Uncharacterized protein n=1 Tax=Yoonia rhodophyticola TaxID=3137370 RepID=A0AAN0MJV5_9RHOB